MSRPLGGAAIAVVAAVVTSAATPAYAAGSGDVKVVNTETVQVYTKPTGEVTNRRVYEQLAMTGNGSVDLANPVSNDDLRNLDGFAGIDVKNGEQVIKTTVDGEKKMRSVSAYDKALPLHVSVAYTLDGKLVKPGDVVGKSGKLEVKYTVENITGKKQEVTFKDGKGNTVTETEDVPIPMVGSLSTVAPPSFTNVKSAQANMAGDGQGGTKLSFTMTLFPPIGSTTAVFGYTADIKDGVVPRAEISALPVNPLQSPSFSTAATSYQGGADTGTELTDGATQIDTNLLKLRDGAATLLGGLIKLRDGAGDLQAGLAGQALPGSKKLASGASDLSTGIGQINSGSKRLAEGSGELSTGANQLAAGTSQAASGSKQLAEGTKKLSNGAGDVAKGAKTVDGYMKQIAAGQGDLLQGLQLLEAGVKALPTTVQTQLATDPQYQALLGGMQKVVNGIGDPTDVTSPVTGQPATLFGGLNAINYGLTNPASTPADCAAHDLTKCGATDALDLISTKISGALNGPASADGTVAKLKATILSIAAQPGCDAACQGYVSAVAAGVETAQKASLNDLKSGVDDVSSGIKTNITGPGAAIAKLKAGLVNPGANTNCAVGAATPSPADDCGIKQAVSFFKANIPVLVDGITASIRDSLLAGISAPAGGCTAASKTLICGAQALASGGSDLAGGTGKLVGGANDLSAGASLLNSKTGELSNGLGRIDDGAQRLAAGGRKLANGSTDLANGAAKADDGSQQVANGASDLSDGLGTAADGSIKLHKGLVTAAGGAPKLKNGAQELSDKGTKKLIGAGNDTTEQYGELYAVMAAGAQRANTEDMAYGTPQGAIGLTAYNYIIKGADGESSRNLARGLGGLAILGAGGAVFALRRRFI